MDLKDIFINAGAPVLKSIIENSVGGIGGKIAGGVIDEVAKQLGTPPTEEAIVKQFELDPVKSTQIIQSVDQDMARIVESSTQAMLGYQSVLLEDIKSEGILSRLWRPLFAIVFTLCYAVVIVTICWLMWTRQLGTLTNLTDVTGFMTFAFIAGCAVLGVQIWQRDKKE